MLKESKMLVREWERIKQMATLLEPSDETTRYLSGSVSGDFNPSNLSRFIINNY